MISTSITIIPGQWLHKFQVLSVDPTGKRACVSCACGSVHVFSAEALLSGTAMCSAVPLTSVQREAMRDEIEADERRRRLDLKNWRPEGRS